MVHKIVEYVSNDEISPVDKITTAAIAVGLIGVAACTISGMIVSTGLVANLISKWQGASSLAKTSASIASAAWKSAIVAGVCLAKKVKDFVSRKNIDRDGDDYYGFER